MHSHFKNGPIRIAGIDPAPGKGSTVATATVTEGLISDVELVHARLAPAQVRDLLAGLAKGEKRALVCWDAPLTGPPQPDHTDAGDSGDFTIRSVERLFRTKKWIVPGISVQGYAGCQHWALSRNALGHPRVGPFDRSDTPWSLLADKGQRIAGHQVVEVHPGLALLFWLAGNTSGLAEKQACGLLYKVPPVEHFWKLLLTAWEGSGFTNLGASLSHLDVTTDDHLDAVLALALGILLALDNGEPAKVGILGTAASGAFLLPRVPLFELALADLEVLKRALRTAPGTDHQRNL